uniref:Uncharacterized protein n=1 Tax=Romanomermis culicivorax TaxID=13658 RepID=A0A915HUA8_ROMCU
MHWTREYRIGSGSKNTKSGHGSGEGPLKSQVKETTNETRQGRALRFDSHRQPSVRQNYANDIFMRVIWLF